MTRNTKARILDAAERLFAESGFEAVSIRRIISEAGVNAAAIHYHFGSKQELACAVYVRFLVPLNRERLRLLDSAERQAGSKSLPIDDVLFAFVAPTLRLAHSRPSGLWICRLVAEGLVAPPAYSKQPPLDDLFGQVQERFELACRRALPHLPEMERAWRKQLAAGSLVYILRQLEFIFALTGRSCNPADIETATRRIIGFLAAGLEAPLRYSRERRKRKAH